jgi:hypothetical protein
MIFEGSSEVIFTDGTKMIFEGTEAIVEET